MPSYEALDQRRLRRDWPALHPDWELDAAVGDAVVGRGQDLRFLASRGRWVGPPEPASRHGPQDARLSLDGLQRSDGDFDLVGTGQATPFRDADNNVCPLGCSYSYRMVMPIPGQRLFLGGMSRRCMSTTASRSRVEITNLGSRSRERSILGDIERTNDPSRFVRRTFVLRFNAFCNIVLGPWTLCVDCSFRREVIGAPGFWARDWEPPGSIVPPIADASVCMCCAMSPLLWPPHLVNDIVAWLPRFGSRGLRFMRFGSHGGSVRAVWFAQRFGASGSSC